ncbi:MAG: divalent metal cation transporter [Candidatus Thorarchaeota archaeon]|nr:MAG: divalent metal cation transporter [Candidatus Thorarchaeota archaeon]
MISLTDWRKPELPLSVAFLDNQIESKGARYSEMSSAPPKAARSPTRVRNSQFLKFFGPALVVSVAYVDPGNFGTAIAAGAGYNYDLLWVVWLASIMAMLLQYLSGKIGIVTGRSMPDLVRERLKSRRKVLAYWLSCETFAVATDLAEFLGVALALNLLLGIPLLWAAAIASFDVIFIFALAGRKFRRIETLVGILVSIIGFGYVYEIFITQPDFISVALHSVTPTLTPATGPLVIGIIGATVMPHALAVHSWLTKNKLTVGDDEEKHRLLRYHFADNAINLSIAGLVNAAILIMAAAAFSGTGEPVNTLEQAYHTLTPLFGVLASSVFAITLLASGLSSSTTGVLAGQALMEGLLGRTIHPWLRRVVLRVINVVPTFVAIYVGFNALDLLVYSQVILSLLIPLPLIPILYLTASKRVMGQFVNRTTTTLVALAFALLILAFNAYFLVGVFLQT